MTALPPVEQRAEKWRSEGPVEQREQIDRAESTPEKKPPQ
jgi:hypothetical protein